MALSQLESFKATIAHKRHDGVLFYSHFSPGVDARLRQREGLGEDANLREFFGMFDPVMLSLREPAGYSAPDFTRYYEDIDIPEDASIDEIGVLHIPGSMHHFTRYISPLREANRFEQIETFPYPDFCSFSDEHIFEETKAAHAQGKVVTYWVGHIYENSWQIRGYEQFLMDMVSQPDWSEFILDKLMERNLITATAAARAGADYIITGDDVANQNTLMFDIGLWRKMMKSRWAKVYAAVREIKPDIEIWYHSDGNITDIIPELIEIGVTILNPVQPECLDPVMVKTKYGEKLVIDGTIGTQTTMPFGSSKDVKETVKERVRTLGYDGALILSPTHLLEPEVPLENIDAFVETAKNIGLADR